MSPPLSNDETRKLLRLLELALVAFANPGAGSGTLLVEHRRGGAHADGALSIRIDGIADDHHDEVRSLARKTLAAGGFLAFERLTMQLAADPPSHHRRLETRRALDAGADLIARAVDPDLDARGAGGAGR